MLKGHRAEENRADYYNYYTGNRWGDINNYDFAINTSKVSFEEAADGIEVELETNGVTSD